MAADKDPNAEINTENISSNYIESEDIVNVSVGKAPRALITPVDNGYTNITNRSDVESRLELLGLSWEKFVKELNKLPQADELTEISADQINTIFGTLMVNEQESSDLRYAAALDNEINREDEDDQKQSEIKR